MLRGGGGGGGGGGTYTPQPDVLADVTASFNIDATHVDQTIPCNSTGAIVATVQPDSTVSLRLGAVVTLMRKGAGGVSFAPGAGVTLLTSRSLAAYAQNSIISAKRIGANLWVILGEML